MLNYAVKEEKQICVDRNMICFEPNRYWSLTSYAIGRAKEQCRLYIQGFGARIFRNQYSSELRSVVSSADDKK